MVQQERNTTTMTKTTTTDSEIQFCRLCLEENDLTANLFYDEDSDGNKMLSQKLFELFQIKYEKTPSLPNRVCKNCLEMIQTFSVFRENVHKIESELQKRVVTLKYGVGSRNEMLKVIDDPPREGLNGHPGAFVPEENEVIIEVDPDIDFESSDDDFSMDSDSEVEDEYITETKVAQVEADSNKQLESSSKVQNASAMNVDNKSARVEGSKIIRAIETSILISWNIIEKSYVMEGEATKITYSCQYCDTTFGQKEYCEEHVSRHNTAAPFRCSFCSLEFINRPELITHVRALHESERPYICTICKKGFLRRSDLQKHTIVHTGIRPFACSICSKSFSRNTNLTKHLRVHKSGPELARNSRTQNINKGEEPITDTSTTASTHQYQQKYQLQQYEMDIKGTFDSTPRASDRNTSQSAVHGKAILMSSDETTNRSSILAAHLLQPPQPTTPKPSFSLVTSAPPKQSHYSRQFACEICSQTFSRGRDYQRHQALHLDTLFSCKQCGMIFSRREKLARHELYQHAPQYPCNICRIPFLKQSEYELHMKMHELQQSVTATAQAASLLSSGGYRFNNQQQQQPQQQLQQYQQQTSSMLPPPTKEHRNIQQRPSMSDMNFYGQMLPTMNLGFYSESHPDEKSGA